MSPVLLYHTFPSTTPPPVFPSFASLTCVCPLTLLACPSSTFSSYRSFTFLPAWLCLYLFLDPCLYHYCLFHSTFHFSSFTSPLCFCPSLYAYVFPLPFPRLCISASLSVLSSPWNSSGGCPRLLPTTIEGCINIACQCLIDHSNARNTEPATRPISVWSSCLHT